jgi:hypothetical protein
VTRSFVGVERWRWLALLVGVVLLVVAFVTSGSSTATVARVAGKPIGLTSYRHWVAVSAVSAHASDASLPPFVPDAPSYSRCIAFERAAEVKAHKSVPSEATLRTDCSSLRTSLAESAVELLVSGQWILDQGVREHVTPSAAQVRSALHSSFPKASGLVHFLSTSKLSRADLEFELRVALTGNQLSARHSGATPTVTAAQISAYYTANRSQIGNETLQQATPAIRQALIAQAQAPAVEAYLTGVQKYWLQRTTCARGYRITNYCHVA